MKLVTYRIDIPAWAPQLAAMVGLGVGIDYALFLVTRHRENLALGMPVAEAAGRALATAGQAVIFAGGTRSEEHTSELQSLMRNSYAVFCLKKKKNITKEDKQTLDRDQNKT